MKKLCQILTVVSIFAIAPVLWAGGVLQTDMGSAKEVVTARKLVMRALGANMKDINDKIKSGRIVEIGFNAGTIGAFSVMLPPLYREAHEGVYPLEGSKSFYKAGAAVDFEKAAQELKTAADNLKAAAEKKDMAGASEGFGILKSSCGACHSVFRGKY